MIKKILISLILVVHLSTSISFANAESNDDKNVDIHFPIISAPVGFFKGAYWGTKAVAGALGDEKGGFENLFGFIIGAPVGAVSGTVAGIFGGPFTDKHKNETTNNNEEASSPIPQ